jgi:hypothetical protein
MNGFLLGVYWHDRVLTLRQYADAVKKFLLLLQSTHPTFMTLASVGNEPNSAAPLAPNLTNLDDLIFQYAWDSDLVYDKPNMDGSPSWESHGRLGFDMRFNTGKAADEGGISVGICAGVQGELLSNAVTIRFPPPDILGLSHGEFYDYDFLKNLFIAVIRCWKPDNGLVFSHDFSLAVDSLGLPGIGWLTYLRDPRALALRNDTTMKGFIVETVDHDGTLISLDRQLISPDNTELVEQARFLRNKLIAENLIAV